MDLRKLAAATGAALVLVGVGDADAKSKVKLALPAQVDAKAPIAYSYRARGRKVRLQRQMGTANVWRSVKRLHAGSGSGALRGLPMGAYRLRVRVARHGKAVFSPVRQVKVFDDVSLATLLHGKVHTKALPDRVFPYVIHAGNFGGVKLMKASAGRSVCRSVHLDVAAVRGYNTTPSTIKFLFTAADPFISRVELGQVASLDVPVTPGQAWVAWSYGDTKHAEQSLFVNGHASCWSTRAMISHARGR